MAIGINNGTEVSAGSIEITEKTNGRKALAWILGGVVAGAIIGGIAWSFGADQLDACALQDCMRGVINVTGVDMPFSGDEFPALIETFGQGH